MRRSLLRWVAPPAVAATAVATVLLAPAATAVRRGQGFVLNGVKSGVVRGADAEVFVVGAELDGEPRLFLVESRSEGITIESDPSMGLRAASMSKLLLDGSFSKVGVGREKGRIGGLRGTVVTLDLAG